MKKDWKMPAAIFGAGAIIAAAVYMRPIEGQHEIRLSERELIRFDADTGISEACTTYRKSIRCVTLFDTDKRFMPYIRDEMREVGVRDLIRSRLKE